jgi:hypothetical protein
VILDSDKKGKASCCWNVFRKGQKFCIRTSQQHDTAWPMQFCYLTMEGWWPRECVQSSRAVKEVSLARWGLLMYALYWRVVCRLGETRMLWGNLERGAFTCLTFWPNLIKAGHQLARPNKTTHLHSLTNC